MTKKNKNAVENKTVRSINKNVRSSTRKLKPILKSIVGKKVDLAIRDLTFSDKRISIDLFLSKNFSSENLSGYFFFSRKMFGEGPEGVGAPCLSVCTINLAVIFFVKFHYESRRGVGFASAPGGAEANLTNDYSIDVPP